MLLLALDTSSALTSVCVLDTGRIRSELSVRPATQQAARHLAVIDTAVKQAGIAPGDIEAFAVTVGPGSFTGLRVGLAIIKGLAPEGRPVFPVSTLAALARSAGGMGTIVPCIDAKKHEVYAAVYQDGVPIVAEGAYAPASFAELAAPVLTEPSVWTGDGARLYGEVFAGAGRAFTSATFDLIRPAAVAALGFEAWQRGGRPSADKLVPNYLRASEAEKNQGSKKKV